MAAKKLEIKEMSVDLSEQEQKFFRQILQYPCVICRAKAEAPMAFTPQNPEAFGIEPGRPIYVGICLRCIQNGIDFSFVEALLHHSGFAVELDE